LAVEEREEDLVPRQGLEGEGAHELGRGPRHRDAHAAAAPPQAADDLAGLVGGDAAGHAEDDVHSSAGSASASCGSGSRAIAASAAAVISSSVISRTNPPRTSSCATVVYLRERDVTRCLAPRWSCRQRSDATVTNLNLLSRSSGYWMCLIGRCPS